MNVFYLDECPRQAAACLVDKHVVKMPIECAQLLSTAHRMLDGTDEIDGITLYKATHKNHPSAIWARSSLKNYQWLFDHYVSICCEYNARYGKNHKSGNLRWALAFAPKSIPVNSFEPPPQVMPDQYKSNNTISSYRSYYKSEKGHIAKWSNTNRPQWF